MNRDTFNECLDILYQKAKEAEAENEVPVSALLLLEDGTVLSAANRVEEKDDPLSHAEMNVIKEGLERSNSRYLKNAVIFVSLEPCLMCLGAIIKAGIKELYYVKDDPKLGSLSHYHAYVDDTLKVTRVEDRRFDSLLDDFFQELRS